MPVVRLTSSVALWCALLMVGCRSEPPNCSEGTVTADPREIPAGANQTNLLVDVHNPSPDNGLAVVTELSATGGTIADRFARETTYACAFDFSGPAEVCVETTYEDAEDPGLTLNAASLQQKRRGPNVYFSDPLECSTTRCTVVTCPEIRTFARRCRV